MEEFYGQVDQASVETHLVAISQHLSNLGDAKERLVKAHLLCHILGLDEGDDRHDDILHDLDVVEDWLQRGLRAIWC